MTLADVLATIVNGSASRLAKPTTIEAKVAGSAVLRRLLEVAGSPDLHAHVRIAIDEALDVTSPREAVTRQLEAVRQTLREERGPLPVIPLGTPI